MVLLQEEDHATEIRRRCGSRPRLRSLLGEGLAKLEEKRERGILAY
jgi:hypothetical protein